MKLFKTVGFLMFTCFGMNLGFCSAETSNRKSGCFKQIAETRAGVQSTCFQGRDMSDGVVCSYNPSPKPSACDACKKKKKG